jgi:hypothetical protein
MLRIESRGRAADAGQGGGLQYDGADEFDGGW